MPPSPPINKSHDRLKYHRFQRPSATTTIAAIDACLDDGHTFRLTDSKGAMAHGRETGFYLG